MAKFYEETLKNFICEFSGIIGNFEPIVDKPEWPQRYHIYVDEDYFFRYSDKIIGLEIVVGYNNSEYSGYSFEILADTCEESVQEFTGDEDVVIFFCCEGDLYADLYEFHAYGVHPEVEGLLKNLRACTDKYGMYWDWADGAMKFYDVEED